MVIDIEPVRTPEGFVEVVGDKAGTTECATGGSAHGGTPTKYRRDLPQSRPELPAILGDGIGRFFGVACGVLAVTCR